VRTDISTSLEVPELCPRCRMDRNSTGFLLHLSDNFGNAQTVRFRNPDQMRILLAFCYGFNWYSEQDVKHNFPLRDAAVELCTLFGLQPERFGIILPEASLWI